MIVNNVADTPPARRILFVDHAEALGGAEHSLLLLLQLLDPTRYVPLLACNAGPLADAARDLGVPVYPVPMPRLRGQAGAFGDLAQGSSALVELIHREQVDLVHSNVMRASFYAALAARRCGRPLVWHVRDIHAPGQPGGLWYPFLMCSLATRVIAISHAVAAGLPCSRRVTVIYNGLDLARFDPHWDAAAARQALSLPADRPVVGILGRVQPWKGQAQFLCAAALVAQTHPSVHFAVIGGTIFAAERDYLQELRTLADKLGIAQRVTFTGHCSDVPMALAGLDLLVHCSQAEPFGRVLIEAMAMEKPVVAFADGGVPEIVQPGVSGVLVFPGDIPGMARTIQELLDDPERVRTMGRAGRERVAAHFDARQTARAVEAVYDAMQRQK